MRILLIETDRFLARNIQRAFKRAGHKVEWLIDLQSAINAADATVPQAVILDLLLADRSGIEFLYEFRSYPEWSAVPIIVYSNIPSAELEACAGSFAQLGIRDFLYKPTTALSELISTVERSSLLVPAIIPE